MAMLVQGGAKGSQRERLSSRRHHLKVVAATAMAADMPMALDIRNIMRQKLTQGWRLQMAAR